MLHILLPRSQTCLAAYQVVQILTSGWIKIHGTHVIHGGCVTCCKTSLPWAVKTRNMCGTLLQNKELLSTFCQNFSELEITSFVARQVRLLGGNTRNNSLCNNVAKQVARFCCLFHRIFTKEITTLLALKNNNNN